jgi:hypothetical protein
MTTDPELVPVAQGIERWGMLLIGSKLHALLLSDGEYVKHADHARIVAELQKVAMVIQNERIARQTAEASLSECRAELAALRARVEADTARLDWLDTQRQDDVGTERNGDPYLIARYWTVCQQKDTIRDAIDAARLLAAPAGGEG